jgi:uncharacterized repeat protein (TIGR02543 family)
LKLGTINGKPVIKIAANAFAYKPAEGRDADITSVITKVELPATIEVLEKNLFEGVETPIEVDIPQNAPVLEKIVEAKIIEALDLDAGATKEEIAAAVAEAGGEIIDAIQEAVNKETTAVLQEAVGKEGGYEVKVPEPDSGAPTDPSEPQIPIRPPVVIVEKPDEITPAPDNRPDQETPSAAPPAPAVITYRVTYNGNGGTGTVKDANRYASGTMAYIQDGSGFTKANHAFVGWVTDLSVDGPIYKQGDETYGRIPITGNITLYAKWIAVYTVTYEANGGDGTVGPTTYKHGAGFTTRPADTFTKTGYNFTGWRDNTNGVSYDADTQYNNVNKSITLVAQWAVKTYTVTYNDNGSDGGVIPTDGTTYQYGQPITVLGNTGSLEKKYYTFAGWNTEADGSGETDYTAGDNFVITPNTLPTIAFYAKWTPDNPPMSVDSISDLSKAITAVKKLTALTGAERIIQLTEDFYDEANSGDSAIVIDAGTDRNTVPYTIQGLGKDGGSGSDKILNVGILLANDNVTLDQVKMAVTESSKATATAWTATAYYYSAIVIRRATDDTPAFAEGDALPAKDVTIQNCDISIDLSADSATNFTAGIYVGGAITNTDTPYLPKDIFIKNNTVTAKGYGGGATQGIFIDLYDYSVKIKSNTVSAQYGTAQTGKRYGAPASALFFNKVFDLIGEGSPDISGNTLVLNTDSGANAFAYSFFINAFETNVPGTINQHGGVAVLRGDHFALADTKWALAESEDEGSSYKKLFNALLANITSETNPTGFGSVSIPYEENSYEREHYHIDNGAVTRISVLGDHLNGDGNIYAGDSEGNVFNSAGGGTPNGVDYGSFTVTDGVAGEKSGKFYFTYSNSDTDYNY